MARRSRVSTLLKMIEKLCMGYQMPIVLLLIATTLLPVFSLVSAQGRSQQAVIRYPDTTGMVKDRWEWATRAATARQPITGFWIGYSIERLMEENSFIGTYYSDQRRNRPSLLEVLSGSHQELTPSLPHSDGFTSLEGMITVDVENESARMIAKEIGILVHFTDGRKDAFDNVKVSTLSLHVDLCGEPLFWLGGIHESESIELLCSLFGDIASVKEKRDLISAIGLHQVPELVFPILREFVNSKEPGSVREQALFWIGETDAEQVLPFLIQVAESDRSESVREEAISAIGNIDNHKGTEALIALAQEDKKYDVRKNAMFWLGQRASEKGISMLEKIALTDEDTEIEKDALFALAQLPGNASVDYLVRVANTHRNPALRKEAIFLLGQSDDPRALDALVDIVRR